MTSLDLEGIVKYIVVESVKLKNKYTNEVNAKVEFGDIFSQNDEEFKGLTEAISKMGKIVFVAPTGNIIC